MDTVFVIPIAQSVQAAKVIDVHKPYVHLVIAPYISMFDEISHVYLLQDWTPGVVCAICQDFEDEGIKFKIFAGK